MKKVISFLARYLAPITVITWFGVSVIVLAVADNKKGLLLALLWSALIAALLYWGVYGILSLSRKRLGDGSKELRFLVRATAAAEILLSVGAAVTAIVLYDLPTAANLLPVILLGLGGTLRFHEKYLA